jgi:hypothetical protein
VLGNTGFMRLLLKDSYQKKLSINMGADVDIKRQRSKESNLRDSPLFWKHALLNPVDNIPGPKSLT